LSRIRYGLKLRTNEARLVNDGIKLIEDQVFGYIELLINPQHPDITPFSQFDVEYVVHITHENYGVDIGNPEREVFTLQMLDYGLHCADDLGAKIVIIHAGTGSVENAKNILSKQGDSRIVIENTPKVGLNGETCLGYNSEAMRILTNKRLGICLDFGHAIKASLSLKRDYKEVISEFLELKPKLFHISDGKFDKEIDEHLNIEEGEYDFGFINEVIKKSEQKYITLETPRDLQNSLNEDLENLKKLKDNFS
jgi:deoxyribonuclease-4